MEEKNIMNKNGTNKRSGQLGLFLSISVIVTFLLLFFSTTTSPLYPNDYGSDSAYFRFIGKSILKGKTPYIDIWDNKGPVLYIINAVGALTGTINKEFSLIFLMQVISMIFSMSVMRSIDPETVSEKNKSQWYFLMVLCSVILLCFYYQGGNMTEEWSIPLISISLVLFRKYALQAAHNPDHPCRYAFYHGICLALTALIRINNSVSVCAGIFAIVIYLIIIRRWKNLLTIILAGLAGIAVVSVPICIYLFRRDALTEMFYAILPYNIGYADAHSYLKISNIPEILVRFSPIAVCFLLVLGHIIKNRKPDLTDWITSVILILNTVLLCKTNIYYHYYMITVPVFFFVLIIYLRNSGSFGLLLVLLMTGAYFICDIIKVKTYLTHEKETRFPSIRTLIQEDEKDSVIAIDMDANVYLNTGLFPVSRFACYQPHFLQYGEGFEEEFLSDLQEKRPKWVIMSMYDPGISITIKDFIENNYEYSASDPGGDYWHLID